MRRIKTRVVWHKLTAYLLCLCMLLSLAEGVGSLRTWAAPESGGPTGVNTREADPNTMETYKGKLLSGADGSSSETTGSRYAGRVWSDKTVLRYEDSPLQLTMADDGYESAVSVDADFLHVYSTLTSSQVVNEYPPSPIDLVIVFDMSGSMGQDTRYSIDPGGNGYQAHESAGDSTAYQWPAGGVSMADRIKNSRVQKTLDAINNTIDGLMAQNEQNRVAVCGYGANATVLLPLAHYRHTDEKNPTPYLSVGGMETLYHPSDLVYKTTAEGVDADGWYWQNNRDTCYTVVVNAGNESSDYTEPLHDLEGKGEGSWKPVGTRTVSNNVKGNDKEKDDVKAFPGVAKQDAAGLEKSEKFSEISKLVYEGAKGGTQYAAQSEKLTEAMAATDGLEADDYVGYFTNTQGGIYLAYKQLADSKVTTYAETLTNGVLSTVARIPAAIIMSDGGANFAFNEMGNDSQPYTAEAWNARYGTKSGNEDPENLYINDDVWDSTDNEGRYKDVLHRLGGTPDGVLYNTGDEWYKVFLPGKDTLGEGWDGLHGIFNIGADFYADGTLSSQPAWNHAGVLYSSDNNVVGTSGTVLQVLLTASYMNAVVKKHYENGWAKNGATEESRVPLSTFTMNVDTEHVPQWGRLRLYPTLDPKRYSLDTITTSEWYNEKEKFGTDSDLGYGDALSLKAIYDGLARSWREWKGSAGEGGVGGTTEAVLGLGGANGYIMIKTSSIAEATKNGSSADYNAGGGDRISVTDADILANMAYDEKFYDVTSAELENIFEEILSIILGKVFVPVSGSNDAGVGNSITYQDPIGLYMELKHDAVTATPYHTDNSFTSGPQTYDMAMLLFGEMHGVVRTGVYDAEWIDQYNKAHQSSPFTPGWYKGEDGATAQKTAETKRDENGSTYPAECKSPQDAWKQGWVMRLDFNTLAEYVPIVEEEGEQTQNTTYTVYRFSCPQDDRNKLRINPVYGDKVPDTVQKAWDDAVTSAGGSYPVGNSIYAETPGVYRLSDIRIWTEDTGDFVDEDGVLAPNTGYDTSLYVNIPAAALPTQLAEITMGPSGVMSYKTNLGADHKEEPDYAKYCAQSTPFRLFYAVGVDDYLITRDAAGNQTGINVAMLPDDYIKSHTENGRVYFYSNYYSGSVYQGYGSDAASEYRTMGDPTVSFAAGTDNRYYVYQKPLPLYAHAYRVSGDRLQPVDRAGGIWSEGENQIGGNGAGIGGWEDGTNGGTWAGGRYMGVYDDENAFKTALDAADDGVITDRNGVKYKVVEGGIVFLQSDLLDQVRANEGGSGYADHSVSFSSSDYFFLALEFYLPDKSNQGKNLEGEPVEGTYAGEAIQYVVSRKGGAFGSELHAENIGNGDMLCWTDIGPNSQRLQFEYLSYTVTGDRFRGEPTLELFTKKGRDLKTYLQERGLKDVAPAEGEKSPLQEAVEYWTKVQEEYHDTLMLADKDGSSDVTQEEFNEYFHWAVATKPGGLRVGDMFRNMQAKDRNVTNTATNFYVPTVSPNARIGDIVINNYLGNNGRLYVENSHLYVGKLIDIPEDDPNREALLKTRFEYQVYIQNYTGPMDAVVLRWNRLGNGGNGTWQRQLNTIDVLTSNEGLLLDGDKTTPSVVGKVNGRWEHLRAYTGGSGDPVYYLYEDLDENGQPIAGKQPATVEGGNYYYIYVGGDVDEDESSEHVKRLFQNTSGDDPIENTGVNHAGRTVYMTEKDYTALKESNQPTQSTAPGTYWSVYESTTDTGETGSMDYWFKEAYLIPVGKVTSSIAASGGSPEPLISLMALDSSGWSFDLSDVGEYEHLGFAKETAEGDKFTYDETKYNNEVKEYLCIAHLDQNVDSTDVTITSQFALKSEYMTRTVYFGNKTEETTSLGGAVTATEKGEALKESDLFDARPVGGLSQSRVMQNVAWFTLSHEEGLLFPGLDAGSDYRIVEKNRPGFLLERATHMQENSNTQYEPDETASNGAKATGGNLNADTAYFQKDYYSLDGDTASIKEEGGWYVNRYDPGSLSITKVLQAAEGGLLTEEDQNRLFDFTLKLTAPENPEGMTVEGPFKYTVTEGEGQEKKEVRTGRLLPAGTVEGVGATDIVAESGTTGVPEGESAGIWKFRMKGGQTMTVTGLPVESGYTYQISERIPGGYEVSGSEEGKEEAGEHIVTGEVKAGQEGPVEVTFTNTKKYVVGAFSIEKELKTYGEPTEEDKKQTFDFTLKLTNPDTGQLLEGGPFSYTIVDSKGAEVKSGLLLPNGAENPADADMVAEEDGSWKFQLMGGQTITVEGMPVGAAYSYDYTVSELEDPNAAGRYEVSVDDGEPRSSEGGKYTVNGTVKPGNTEPEKVKFTNTQKAEPAKAELTLTKELSDESDPQSDDVEIKAEQYSFVVTPDRKNPEDDPITDLSGWDAKKGVLVVKNGAPDPDGKTAEATIFEEGTEFKTPGTYRYTVTEQVSDEPGVSSDVAVYTVTVEVSKVYDEDTKLYKGELEAKVTVTKKVGTAGTEEDGITFTNVYRMGSIEVPLRVRKEYNGKLTKGAFTFELTGVEVESGVSVLSVGGKNELNSDVDDPEEEESETQDGSEEEESETQDDSEEEESETQNDSEEENGDGAQDKPEKGPGASGDGASGETSGDGTSGEGAQEPGGSVPPAGGSQSGEETGPGSEAQTGGETKPETQPGTTTQSGTETQPGSETQPGTGTSSGTETQTGSGTSSGTESQSGPNTQSGAGTSGQGAAGTSVDSPDGGKPAGTQSASASAPQENGGPANNQTQASDPIALRQGGPLVGPVALRVESQAFRMTALFAKPQAYNQITLSEVPQNPTAAAPQNGGEPSGPGQEDTTGNETGEGETGNLPGDTQTSGTPETDPQTPETSPQTPEESETSPEGTLPPGQTETPGTSGTDSGAQTPGETEQSPEGIQPPEGQETQGDPEEDLESEADEEEDSGTEEELLGESLGVPGNHLPAPTANATLPAPSKYDSVPSEGNVSDGPWRQTNEADGWVDFGTLTFNQAGTYTYELKEVEGEKSYIRYSEDIYRIVITVEEDKDTEGLLKIAGIQYRKWDGSDWISWDGTVPIFTNELKTGGPKVEKKVTGTGGESDREFSFTVEFDFSKSESPEDVPITKNGEPAADLEIDEDGKLEFTLKGDEYVEVEGLPEGTTYTVTETNVSEDGYTTTITDDDGDLKDGKGEIEEEKQDTVTVVNYRPVRSLTVTKTVKGVGDLDKLWNFHVKLSNTDVNGWHGDMFFTDGEADFMLKHGQSATAENLPPNITYTVTEKEANQDGYSTSPSGETGTIPEDGTVNADFVNEKTPPPPEESKGNLTVSKTVTGSDADPNREWHFRIELSDKSIDGRYGDMDFHDGVAEFTLKHGESATARDLPAGLTYTVKESEADQDGYGTSASGNFGTIPENGTARAEYVNRKDPPPPPPSTQPEQHYGGLTVTKTVIGTGGEPDREWHFRVELSDKSINGQYGDMYFTAGAAEFVLRHGESASARDLPAGITYTVTELEANQDGYAMKSAGETGTIPADGTARAEFVNGKNESAPPPTETAELGDQKQARVMPATGDSSHPGFWLALMLLSLAGAIAASVLLIGKKKPRRKDRRRKP